MFYEHLFRFVLMAEWPDRMNFSSQKRASELHINFAVFETNAPQREVWVVEIFLRADLDMCNQNVGFTTRICSSLPDGGGGESQIWC